MYHDTAIHRDTAIPMYHHPSDGFPLRLASALSRSVLHERGRSLSEVSYRFRSSINRPSKHRMVPPDMCDGQSGRQAHRRAREM
eukprot:989224-Prymnesium_polylepis.1